MCIITTNGYTSSILLGNAITFRLLLLLLVVVMIIHDEHKENLGLYIHKGKAAEARMSVGGLKEAIR